MAKKRKTLNQPASKSNTPRRHGPPPPKQAIKQANKNQKKQQLYQEKQKQQNPTIPFDRDERILLIGEGDLSFAASMIKHLGCTNVTATVLDKDQRELLERYPEADTNISIIKNKDAQLKSDTEANDPETPKNGQGDNSPGEEDEDEYDDQGNLVREARQKCPLNNKVLFDVNICKPLPPSLKSKNAPSYHRILFNFPHVGGKSTDVNRQIRYNQDLLLSFFQRAGPLLASNTAADDPYNNKPTKSSSIVVTLFEGEPYTSWNIRDLASAADLVLDHSFQFGAEAYPDYHHARTLGVVRNKKGEKGGGWKGENRPSRSFVFRRKDDPPLPQSQVVSKKKRKRDEDDSDEDEDI